MIELDQEGVLRYKKNRVICDVYESHIDLNEIERRYQQGQYTAEEKYQFLALLGYSFEGVFEKALQDRAFNKHED